MSPWTRTAAGGCSANIAPESLDHATDLGVSRLPADPVQDFRLGEAGGF